MPLVKNTNAHRVSSGNYKMSAGQVKEVSGEEADALTAINGVEESSEQERDDYEANKRGVAAGGPGQLRAVTAVAAELKVAGRQLLVSVPLNTVIGDTAAPYGPNTGTITTKQALAKESEENRRRFAPHERLAGEEDIEELGEIEREQASALTRLEELQAEVAERAEEQSEQSREAQGEQAASEQPTQEQPERGSRKRKAEQQEG